MTTVPAKPVKPGYKTTEFWLTLAVSAGTFLASAASVLPPRFAAIATTVSVGLYALGRGQAKSS